MSEEKNSPLFEDFPPVSTQQWEEKIIQDLKGADYEKKLVWKTREGLSIQPYYRSEHLLDLAHLSGLPGQYPYVRGNQIRGNDWDIRQDINESDIRKANQIARVIIDKGLDAVGINVSNVHTPDDLWILLERIDLENKSVHFLHSSNYKPLFRDFISLLKKKGIDIERIKGSVNFDPLGFRALYGKYYGSADENFRDAMEILDLAKETPRFDVVGVNGQNYHNAGANIIQEIAFVLAHGNEYLAKLTDRGLSVDLVAPYLQFTLAVGSDYFLEIAKLRAIKMLWAKIVEQYAPGVKESFQMNLHAVTSGWNKSVYDPYVNMLRTTTEAMAAAIGGVSSMTVEPFDHAFKKEDAFSMRIARNQQIILKHEAYFNKVADPAGGSYYVEKITDSLSDAAWRLFVNIENQGGFDAIIENGFLYSEIAKSCQQRDMEIAQRRQIFVGVNQYPNIQERMLDKIQPTARLDNLARLRPYRGPQAFETVRMAVENHESKGEKTPGVYLFTWGNLAMRKARATFSTNFFGCAGYSITEAVSSATLDEGIEKALNNKPDILVLCSSDEEYLQMIPVVNAFRAKSPQTRIVVAGNPSDAIAQLDSAGAQHYIHLRTNVLEALQQFNDILGVS